jgi:hypothetical protein
MLWKQLSPRYRKLLRDGQQAEAVVVEAKADRGGGSNVGPGIYGWNVTIRVKLPDGTVDDFKRYIEATDTDAFGVGPGDTVPVRLDPNRPSRVEIDTNALRAYRDARRSEQHAEDDAAVREAEKRLGMTETQSPR